MDSEETGQRLPLVYHDLPSHELFSCSPPSTLYHYTSYDGAQGIITSKSLWLTKLLYLNDKTELRFALDLFRDTANIKAETIKDAEKKEFLKKAAHRTEAHQQTNICVASFCENGDLLSQWRGYGQMDKGMAIGFNSEILKEATKDNFISLWRCIYTPEKHRKIINELVDMLLICYDMIGPALTQEIREDSKQKILGYFYNTLLRVAPVLKNEHFREEQEWRLITRPVSNEFREYNAKLSNLRPLQFYSLDFNTLNKSNCKKIINRVVIGPTDSPSLASGALSVLLDKHGFVINSIGFSQIPYRPSYS